VRSGAGYFALLTAATAVALILGVSIGSVSIPVRDVWDGLMRSDAPASVIVRHLRLPRVLLAFLVGGGLGVCGAALQALVRNPLADPYLLGLSGGAGLGAVTAIALRPAQSWSIPLAAFGGALAAVALVYRLSVVSGRRLDPRVLVLAGVVVGAFASAVMSAVIVLSDAPQLRNAFLWLLGGFAAASWQALGLFVAYALLPLGVLFGLARPLDLLALGDEPALYLGADVERSRRMIYVAASLLTAASVATSGIIGFVGLVIPHALRRVWSPLHATLLPAAFLAGGAFLVLADLAGRVAASPAEIPIGVVTAFCGAPFFALVLRTTSRMSS
jgi:iron complex transport system permease protein